MFAHCLLPALLLLAAAANTSKPLPPFHVTQLAGNDIVEHTNKKNYYIPDGQCYGVLDINEQEDLRCPPGLAFLEVVQVDVWDYAPKAKIEISKDNLTDVTISRSGDCKKEAYVKFAVGCLWMGFRTPEPSQ